MPRGFKQAVVYRRYLKYRWPLPHVGLGHVAGLLISPLPSFLRVLALIEPTGSIYRLVVSATFENHQLMDDFAKKLA